MTTPLPPTNPPTPDNKLPGEAELAALYRQLPRSEPGPALDAAVLRAAAQALSGGASLPAGITERRKLPREELAPLPGTPASPATSPALQSIEYAARARRKQAPHWLIALGSAASLVLVAGLAWHMRESARSVSEPSAQLVNAPTAVVSKPVRKSLAPTAPPATLRGTQPAAQLAHKVADAPAMIKRQASAPRAVAPPSATGNTASTLPPAVAEESMSARAAAPQQAVAAQALGGMAANADQAAPSSPVPAPVASPMPQTMQAPPASSADVADKDTSPQAGDTPTRELDKINQLFAQGHDAEALQRLRRFQQAHPQWPLPPELRARLGQP